jgi:hypothetical protein
MIAQPADGLQRHLTGVLSGHPFGAMCQSDKKISL